MIYDFTTAEMLRLSNVRRWGIVEMSAPQTVAEHTTNVAMIALNIVGIYNQLETVDPITETQQLKLLHACLVHDLPEIYSGDIPAPFKGASGGRSVFQDWEARRFPLVEQLMGDLDPLTARIKAISDLADALLFARKRCVDGRRTLIIKDLFECMNRMFTKESNPDLNAAQRRALRNVTGDVLNEADMHGDIQ